MVRPTFDKTWWGNLAIGVNPFDWSYFGAMPTMPTSAEGSDKPKNEVTQQDQEKADAARAQAAEKDKPKLAVDSKPHIQEKTQLNPFSYVSIIQDLTRFRANSRSAANMYDMPGQVYFRIMFHFTNGSDAQVPQPGVRKQKWTDIKDNSWTGLLAPSWFNFGAAPTDSIAAEAQQHLLTLWQHSSAFNYFILNNEIGRAKSLRNFIELLSSINANSPWYFQNIKGLDTAIERQIANNGADFMFKEERDKITIECLDDSYDQRIGTLLDLYRSVVWSWETKRVMLPSNLRKFDMTIIAFQLPIKGQHVSRNGTKIVNDSEFRLSNSKESSQFKSQLAISPSGDVVVYDGMPGVNQVTASYKAFEFHGCEIDYNTSKSGWGDLSNAEGSVPKFNIDIYYDDMYEIRFNEFIGRHVTDLMNDTEPMLITDDTTTPTPAGPDKKVTENENLPDGQQNDQPKVEEIHYEGQDARKETDEKTNEVYEYEHIKSSGGTELDGDINITKYGVPSPLNADTGLIGKGTPTRNMFGQKPRRGSGILDQIVGHGEAWLGTKIRKVYLGNLFGISLSKIRQQVETAIDGDLFATAANIGNYVRGNYNGHSNEISSNIFPEPTGNDHDRLIELGNLFKANTTINT